MKTFGNLAKAGDAALSLFYAPYKNNRHERRMELHKEEIDLQKICHLDGQHSIYLKLWGVAPGITDINIPKMEQGSVLKFISENIKTLEELGQFSHFIIIYKGSSNPPYVYNDCETVKIYRLSYQCKKLITVNWDWMEMEKEY